MTKLTGSEKQIAWAEKIRTSIEEKDNRLYVYTEYHQGFIDICRRLNGRWNNPAWVFPLDLREEIENILIDIFGYKQNKIDIILYIEQKDLGESFYLVGKQIFSRKSRDYSVNIHADVSVLEGELSSSGGSMKHPAIGRVENLKLLIRNVPENLLHELKEYKYEIKENTKKSKYSDYTKEQLQQMIEEIQKEIEGRK